MLFSVSLLQMRLLLFERNLSDFECFPLLFSDSDFGGSFFGVLCMEGIIYCKTPV